MPGAFTGAPNSNFFDLNPWAPWFSTPGEGAFRPELAYYLSEARKADSGAGLPALAAGQTAQGPALAYQRAMVSPTGLGDASGAGLFSDLMAGQTASRGVGRGVQSDVRNQALSGIGDVANQFTNAMAGQARGDLALSEAQQQQAAGDIGSLSGLFNLGTQLLLANYSMPGSPWPGVANALGIGRGGGGAGVSGAGTPFGGPSASPSGSFGTSAGPFSLGYGPTSSGFMSTVPPTSSGASFGWGSNLGPFSLMGAP